MKKPAKRLIKSLVHRLLIPRGGCPQTPERILVVAVGFLGDIIIIQPFLHSLRKGRPAAKISILIEKGCAPLLQGNYDVDEVLFYDRARSRDPLYLLSLVLSVRLSKYDLGIVHYGHFRLEDVLFLMGIKFIIGYDCDLGFERCLPYDLLSRKVPKDWSRNEIENSFKLLEAAGVRAAPEKESLRIPVREKAAPPATRPCLQTVPGDGRKIIVMHVGAGYQTKKWPPARWARAADLIADRVPATLLITGSAGDIPEQEEILSLMRNQACGLCGKTSLYDLIKLLRRSDLLISTDSGPKHFAYALGVPTVEIYGPSRSWRWGAYWDTDIHLALDIKPDPRIDESLIEDRRYNDLIQQITAEQVCKTAIRLLDKIGRSRRSPEDGRSR